MSSPQRLQMPQCRIAHRSPLTTLRVVECSPRVNPRTRTFPSPQKLRSSSSRSCALRPPSPYTSTVTRHGKLPLLCARRVDARRKQRVRAHQSSALQTRRHGYRVHLHKYHGAHARHLRRIASRRKGKRLLGRDPPEEKANARSRTRHLSHAQALWQKRHLQNSLARLQPTGRSRARNAVQHTVRVRAPNAPPAELFSRRGKHGTAVVVLYRVCRQGGVPHVRRPTTT